MEYNLCFLLQVSLVEEKNKSKHHEYGFKWCFKEKNNIVTFCVYKLFCLWIVFSMNCSFYELLCLWIIVSKNCSFYELLCLWIIVSIYCRVYELMCLWIIVSMIIFCLCMIASKSFCVPICLPIYIYLYSM